MKKLLCLIAVMVTGIAYAADPVTGSWESQDNGTTVSRIYADGFFSVAIYSDGGKQFVGTFGGKYTLKDNQLTEVIEFDTRNPERIGTQQTASVTLANGQLSLSTTPEAKFKRIDNGTPGQLAGAWLITGRINEKKEIRRSTPGARRTMKILSGTRFQWIAYNVDTKEFFGTGGGTYTTADGKYTENISFFSRDASRVGASLGFDFSLQEGEWHHSGLSSKGEPLHEIWTRREKVGI